MKILPTVLLLFLAGCSTTKVIDHDFESVVRYIENLYNVDVANATHKNGYVFPLCFTGLEIKEYAPHEEIRFVDSAWFYPVTDVSSSITIKKKNSTQSVVKVRQVETVTPIPFLHFRNTQSEVDVINRIKHDLNNAQPIK